jgi:hypothetical protein
MHHRLFNRTVELQQLFSVTQYEMLITFWEFKRTRVEVAKAGTFPVFSREKLRDHKELHTQFPGLNSTTIQRFEPTCSVQG